MHREIETVRMPEPGPSMTEERVSDCVGSMDAVRQGAPFFCAQDLGFAQLLNRSSWRAVALPWRKIYKPLNFFVCFSPSKIGTLPAFLGEGPEGTARSAGRRRSGKAAVPLQRNTNVSGRPGGFLVWAGGGCVPDANGPLLFFRPSTFPRLAFWQDFATLCPGMFNA